MNWLRKNWTDILLFVWASIWTAGGIFMAVVVVIENRELTNFKQLIEVLIFVNLAVLITYFGLKTQIGLFKEWKN